MKLFRLVIISLFVLTAASKTQAQVYTDTQDYFLQILNAVPLDSLDLEVTKSYVDSAIGAAIDTIVSTDNQKIDTAILDNNILKLSLERDGVPASEVDFSGLAAVTNWTLNGSDIHNNNVGNVGIGTSTPAAALDVKTSSFAVAKYQRTSNNPGKGGIIIFEDSDGDGWRIGPITTNDAAIDRFSFQDTDADAVFTLNKGGMIQLNEYGSGLNTGTPAKLLAVEADGDVIEVDDDTGTDDQTIDEFSIQNDSLYLSLEGDGEAAKKVALPSQSVQVNMGQVRLVRGSDPHTQTKVLELSSTDLYSSNTSVSVNTTTGVITCDEDGVISFSANVTLERVSGSSRGTAQIFIRKNGIEFHDSPVDYEFGTTVGSYATPSVYATATCVTNDEFEFVAHASTGSYNINHGYASWTFIKQ